MRTSLRKSFERNSAPILIFIHGLPRATVLIVLVGLMFIGLVNTGILGFIALLVVAIFIGWLLLLSWPLLEPRTRLLRALAVLLVIVSAVVRFLN